MSKRINKERAIEILTDLYNHELIIFKNNADEPSESEYTNIDVKQALKIAIESLDNEWVDVRDRLPSVEEKYYLVDTDYGIEIMKWHENPLAKTSNGNGGYKNVWEFEIDDFENKAYKERFINAWKPLPQPYERKELDL